MVPGKGGATEEKPQERTRTTTPVSLPIDLVAWIDDWVERYGGEFHYRSRQDFLLAAARTQRDQDEERILRSRLVEQDEDGLDWDDKRRRR